MGFLDKLLGRTKSDSSEGMQTAPPPASMPAEETHEHSHGEGEHTHDDDKKDQGSMGGGGAASQ